MTLQINLSTYRALHIVTPFNLSFSNGTMNRISPLLICLYHVAISHAQPCQAFHNLLRALFSVSSDLIFQNQLSRPLNCITEKWDKASYALLLDSMSDQDSLWDTRIADLTLCLALMIFCRQSLHKCPVSPHNQYNFLFWCLLLTWASCFPTTACPVPLTMSKPVCSMLQSFNPYSSWMNDCWTQFRDIAPLYGCDKSGRTVGISLLFSYFSFQQFFFPTYYAQYFAHRQLPVNRWFSCMKIFCVKCSCK